MIGSDKMARDGAARFGMRRPMLLLQVAVLMGLLGLAACGKEDSPIPPGPNDQVTYPKIYPTH